MKPGIYESVLTLDMSGAIQAATELCAFVEGIDDADQPDVLGAHLHRILVSALRDLRNEADRLQLARAVLGVIGRDGSAPSDPASQLLALVAPDIAGTATAPGRPAIPLSEAALLTNAHGEPNLGASLRSELQTADRIDLLCAFIKWPGVRVVEEQLQICRQRGIELRVITTTYMGATERLALDRLVQHFGAHVKVQYDALRTRLHAKAWLIRRATGYDTAYVGSSNLSRSALLDGLEWNVRLSGVATPTLLDKFAATFDAYWNDPSFELYDPLRDASRLDEALAEAGGRISSDRVTVSLSGVQIKPYGYQQEMLDEIQAERSIHDRHRNLVVAATGTGKTVLAALDYRRLAEDLERPSLLFVAHRKEILEQSLRTYREVLNDPTFGELFVGGKRPNRWRNVFASVQSLHTAGLDSISPRDFDIVVVDEFHHAEAATYRQLLAHLRPRELLGLTATPERSDGLDVRSLFDGRVAAELRLWDALQAELLCPFHYFGISDGTDLEAITWSRGQYDNRALDALYTGNDRRAALVLEQTREKVGELAEMCALGFCVTVNHAIYMARVFTEAGIPALAVSGLTRADDRKAAIERLRQGEVKALFAADLFNEGVDIPSVNTVLFLRPTESSTIFVQQLGRGLRRTPDKAVLTVLDFVGHHRKEFRFDKRLRALTGLSRSQLEKAVKDEFPFVPAGCDIVLDSIVQNEVLANLHQQLGRRWTDLVGEARSMAETTLAGFLEESGALLSDVIRADRSWTKLCRQVGWEAAEGSSRETALLRRGRALAHVDDPDRAAAYRRLLRTQSSADLSRAESVFARMLFYSLWPDGGGFSSAEAGLAALQRETAASSELSQIVELSFSASRVMPHQLTGDLADLPLSIHSRYSREEILIALDYSRTPPNQFREGVLFSERWNADAFFVTVKKSDKDFSPSTLYRDYAVSPALFHWESQSTTSVASKTGQRYIKHKSAGSHVLLFCRIERDGDFGTEPYIFLGPAEYHSHSGDRPIAIEWSLTIPMPTDLFIESSVAA